MTNWLEPSSTAADTAASVPPEHALIGDLWGRIAEDTAALFLRSALQPEKTLLDVQCALRFAARRANLARIRLADVCHGLQPPVTSSSLAEEAATPVPTRRRAAQTRVLKQLVMAALDAAQGGLSTPAIRDLLSRSGHPFSTAQVNVLLKSMAGTAIVGDSRRPKTWRRTAPGSTPPNAVMIRPAVSPAKRTDVGYSKQSSLFS